MDVQATLTMLRQNSLSITGQTQLSLICFYDNKLSNCLLSLVAASLKLLIHVSVHLLTMKISQ